MLDGLVQPYIGGTRFAGVGADAVVDFDEQNLPAVPLSECPTGVFLALHAKAFATGIRADSRVYGASFGGGLGILHGKSPGITMGHVWGAVKVLAEASEFGGRSLRGQMACALRHEHASTVFPSPDAV
jgi:hypothetical protein